MGVGPTNNSQPSTSGQGGFGVPLSLATNLGLVIAIDHFAIKPLVEKEIIPEFLRGPAIFGGLYGTNRILNKIGLGSGWSWSGLALNMPLFYSAQVMASKGMDALGVPMGNPVNEYGSILIGMSPFYLAQHIPALKAGIASSAGGAGLVGAEAGASIYLSKGTGVLGGLTGGAGVVGGICQALGAGGAVMLGNYVGGLGVDAFSALSGLSKDADYNLVRVSYDQMLAEYIGPLTTGLFGNIIKGMQAIAGYVSEDFSDEVWRGISAKMNDYVKASKEFTKNIEEALLFAPFQGISEEQFKKGDYDMNVLAPNRLVRTLALKDAEGYKNIYNLLKLTSKRNPSAERFLKIFDRDGTLKNLDDFNSYYKQLVIKKLGEYELELNKKLANTGLDFERFLKGEITGKAEHAEFVNKNYVLISRITMLNDLKIKLGI